MSKDNQGKIILDWKDCTNMGESMCEVKKITPQCRNANKGSMKNGKQ